MKEPRARFLPRHRGRVLLALAFAATAGCRNGAGGLSSGDAEASRARQRDVPAEIARQLDAGQYLAAQQALEARLEAGEIGPDSWFALGRARAALNDLLGAREAFVQVITRRSADIDARVWLARVQYLQGDAESALRTVADSRALAPANTELLRIEAAAQVSAGAPEKALDALESLRMLGALDQNARQTLADLYAMLGFHAQARKAYSDVIASGAAQTRDHLALARLDLEDRRWQMALRALLALLDDGCASLNASPEDAPVPASRAETSPSDVSAAERAQAHLLAAQALQGLQNRDRAALALQHATEDDPTLAEAWLSLGDDALARESFDEASRAYQRAMQSTRGKAAGAAGMAELALRRGWTDEALEWAGQAVASAPQVQDYRDLLRFITEEMRESGDPR